MFALIRAAFDLGSRFCGVSCAVLLLLTGMAQAATDAAATANDQPTGSDQSQNGAAPGSEALQEVVVTATRRSEDIQKVPISVTAVSQEQMDIQGERDVTDLVKYTPGLNISTGQGGVNQIAIRGIASGAGAATTGVYIDDTPYRPEILATTPVAPFPRCSTYSASRCCAARRALSSARAPRAVQCAPSCRNRISAPTPNMPAPRVFTSIKAGMAVRQASSSAARS